MFHELDLFTYVVVTDGIVGGDGTVSEVVVGGPDTGVDHVHVHTSTRN